MPRYGAILMSEGWAHPSVFEFEAASIGEAEETLNGERQARGRRGGAALFWMEGEETMREAGRRHHYYLYDELGEEEKEVDEDAVITLTEKGRQEADVVLAALNAGGMEAALQALARVEEEEAQLQRVARSKRLFPVWRTALGAD